MIELDNQMRELTNQVDDVTDQVVEQSHLMVASFNKSVALEKEELIT